MITGGRLVALGLFVLAGVAKAETSAPLSLAEAQGEARARAPEAAALEARLRGAEEVAAQAGRVLRHDPVLTGRYAPGSLVGQPEEWSWGVGLALSLDISGRGPRGAAAEAARRGIQLQREDGLRALDEAVAIAVADLAQTRGGMGRTDRIAHLSEIARDAAVKQLEIGDGNQLDVDAAELDFAVADAAGADARGRLAQAQSRLARLLGRATFDGLVVLDGPESPSPLEDGASFDELVDRDPRVAAAESDQRGARLALDASRRVGWIPEPTLSVDLARARHDIPPGSFGASGPAGLTAAWTDTELVFALALPLPFFDRQREARALGSSRLLLAEAQVAVVRADVRAELGETHAALIAAANAVRAFGATGGILERDFALLEKALRLGALDGVARAQSLRRLQDAGLRYDSALRDWRVARARWVRRSQMKW